MKADTFTAPFGPEIISRTDRNGGYIEALMPIKGELYYRSCVGSVCRYSCDLWQAELYLDQLLAIASVSSRSP